MTKVEWKNLDIFRPDFAGTSNKYDLAIIKVYKSDRYIILSLNCPEEGHVATHSHINEVLTAEQASFFLEQNEATKVGELKVVYNT